MFMTEIVHTNGDVKPRIEVGDGIEELCVISGILDEQHHTVWIDEIDIPATITPHAEEVKISAIHFAHKASAAGAETLRLVCPQLQDLRLLTEVFPHDKFSFYETAEQTGHHEQVSLPYMDVPQALASLQEIEAIETSEYFPTNWFDVCISLR